VCRRTGYVNYEPKTKSFEFATGEGLSVHLGTWERKDASRLKVGYRFAFGENSWSQVIMTFDVDKGISGAKEHRPSLDLLLADCKKAIR
jgi:hypothetical protein